MLAQVNALALYGLEARSVLVEVDVTGGLPLFDIVGLPDTSVRESRDRVRSGLRNSGFDFPVRRITVNMAPADMRKVGASFDLAIALGVLAATQQIPVGPLATACFAAELALDGQLRGVQGALCLATTPPVHNVPPLLVMPTDSAAELALAPQARPILVAQHLRDVVGWLRGGTDLRQLSTTMPQAQPVACADLSEVRGQPGARRALEIAAAGGHHMLLFGPPGEGKTMLATRLPGILPPTTPVEALQVAQIYSAAGLLNTMPLGQRPFRSPHHTITSTKMLGGVNALYPGEITLAHNGVLFLDEIPEFRTDVLTALRQPMEDGYIVVGRGVAACRFPAQFQIVAAANPCPCGWLGDGRRSCCCSDGSLMRYKRRLSGPLLDRFDLFAVVHPVHAEPKSRGAHESGESTASVRQRVEEAWQRQCARLPFTGSTQWANARLPVSCLQSICNLDDAATALLSAACGQLGLSTRGVDRVMRVARTIADLAGKDKVVSAHVAEAISYRQC